MKRIKTFIFAMMALTTVALTFQSCLDDDDNYLCIDTDTSYGVVTLKPTAIGNHEWFIQLSDSSIVTCSNIKKFPYDNKKEYRAYIYFKFDSEPSLAAAINYIYAARPKS